MTWYIARDGSRVGPYSHQQLIELVGSGELKPDDLVWKAGLASWTKAVELDGIFMPPPLDDIASSSKQFDQSKAPTRSPIARLRSFVSKHWRGELSADAIFWRVLVLTSIVYNVTIGALDSVANDAASSLEHYRLFTALALMFLPLTIGLVTWQIVGTWRHASKLASMPAKIFCKAFVVLWIVFSFAYYRNSKPSITDRVLVAIGDPYLSDWSLSFIEANGRRHLYVRGPLGVGVSKQVKSALDSNPDVRSVVIDSTQGRVGEGMLLFSLLHDRKISAHINSNCAGACTIAYLGARVRTANQASKFGFQCTSIGHQCLNLANLRRSFPPLAQAKVNWQKLADFSESESERSPSIEELRSAKLIHFVADEPTDIDYDQVFVDPDDGNEYTFDEIDWSKHAGVPESEKQNVDKPVGQSAPAKSGQ